MKRRQTARGANQQRQGKEKVQRHQKNCHVCRARKKLCEPRNRIWNNSKQEKCSFCLSNDLECGPNLTKSAEQEHQQRLRNTQITPNRTVATPQAGEEAEQGGMSVDQLRQEAFAKLQLINILAILRAYYSYDRLYLTRHGYQWAEWYKKLVTMLQKIVGELHTSFIRVVELGFVAVDRGLQDLAQLLFSRLLHPLDEYEVLYDDAKRTSLLRIARYLQEHQLECEAARVFERISRIRDLPTYLLDTDPQELLAKSFISMEKLTSPLLLELWHKTYGTWEAHSNHNLPAWHRAARQQVCGLASTVQTFSADQHLQCDMLGQGMLHIAAATGSTSMVEAALSTNGDIDSRDNFGRTALIIAAADGHADICSRLLACHADAEARDCCNRTVLEIAATCGHLDAVKVLVAGGALVNPNFVDLSTPILAALDSHNQERDNLGVIRYLLHEGANVYTIPFRGMHNAISAAEEKGLIALAAEMRLLQPRNSHIWAPGFLND